MKNNTTDNLAQRIDREFLPFVRQPGRYIGGEVNQVKKDLTKCSVTAALCFPDVYEVAMSNNGIAILYSILNNFPDIAAERCFTPWIDAEQILREKNIPLFSLESKASLKDFDVIGFSLSTELCYTNVLNMLDLAGLEIRSENRKESDPLIIAGGSMANCAEPVAPFIDLFVIGEGEDAVVELANLIKTEKQKGSSKHDILLKAAQNFHWAYVPRFYKFEYEGDDITGFKPLVEGLPTKFENAIVKDFENTPAPLAPIVPFVQAVHERVSIEIMRGCPGRCRFCQASFCRRPIRFRSPEKIFDIAKEAWENTGFDTISLLSLSTADYPQLEKLTEMLHEYFRHKYVGLSLPSLRVDKQLKLLPKLVNSVRKAGLTIAIEAAPERLRKIINKPLKDVDLFAAVEAAYRAGWQKIKLYFMTGLPGETEDDIRDIVRLCEDLARLRKKVDGKTANINAAVSWLVPKPHTPFGPLPQKSKEYFENAKKIILDEKRDRRIKFIQFKFHEIDCSILESAIGRGDRRIAPAIENAWKYGARFDLWKETFNLDVWQRAFEDAGLSIPKAAQKEFDTRKMSPWDHLGGPKKDYILDHLQSSLELFEEGE